MQISLENSLQPYLCTCTCRNRSLEFLKRLERRSTENSLLGYCMEYQPIPQGSHWHISRPPGEHTSGKMWPFNPKFGELKGLPGAGEAPPETPKSGGGAPALPRINNIKLKMQIVVKAAFGCFWGWYAFSRPNKRERIFYHGLPIII